MAIVIFGLYALVPFFCPKSPGAEVLVAVIEKV